MWSVAATSTGWYYFGQEWNRLDFAGSTFNTSQFEIIEGVVNLRAGGITNDQIASNANISASKIDLGAYSTTVQMNNLLSAKANDNNVVHLTGDETVAGIKTFSSIPVLPSTNPTTDNQAVRKAYVDSQVSIKATDTAVVHLAGSETITGVKTFSSSPIVPTPTTNAQATNKQYVDTGLSAKQNALTPGYGITISGNTISGRPE